MQVFAPVKWLAGKIMSEMTCNVSSGMWTFSPPIPLRLYTSPYWFNPLFLNFDIRVLWCPGLNTQLRHSEWQVSGTPAKSRHYRFLQPCSSARCRHLFWSESWSPRLSHLRGLLLPTSPTPTSSAVVGLRIVGYTRLCRCEFTDWLLQHCSWWCTKHSNGQVTACVERRCARRHRHSEVWLWPG